MLKLEGRFVQQLLGSPESGMGYQRLEITTPNYERRRGIAYNADLVLFEDELRAQLRTATYEKLVDSAPSSAGQIILLRVVANEPRSEAVREQPAAAGGEAKNAAIEMTTTPEEFKRFSAYSNDRRVMSDGSLLPGTYATTAADALHVTTGSQAVARYALPNPQPATNVFTSKPPASTSVQRGIVAPAYGQPGGGVEVIFPAGTPPATTTGPATIPP